MLSQAFSDEQVCAIDAAGRRILSQIGVEIPHEDMLSRFADSGAEANATTHRVRIPLTLIETSLASVAKQFTLYGRDLSRTASFGTGTRNYNAIAGEALWVDEVGGERRYTTLEDVGTATRFCDSLKNINIAGAMADPREIPVNWRCVAVAAEMIRNTTKPITFWFHDRASAKYIVEMLIALRGDRASAESHPICYPFLEPISPLRFPFNGIDLLFETAELNLPVPIGPMAQMGLSAPMSIAGTMAQQHAEILAGVCITQLIRPGMPVCYGGICHAFDMRTTQMIFGGPEQAIFGVGMTQLGKHCGLPVYINVGLTDAKCPDAQSGLEAGITLMLGAAAGADIFGHMGICGVDQATSLDTLVLQDEIIGYVESVMRPLDLSDEALGLHVLEDVGPGGTFVDTMHTAERFRKELWFPRLLDREYYQAWKDAGSLDAANRCKLRKDEIIANAAPEPLSPEMDRALQEIVASAKKKLT